MHETLPEFWNPWRWQLFEMGKSKGPAQAAGKDDKKRKGRGSDEKVEEKEKGVDSMEVRHILVEKHGTIFLLGPLLLHDSSLLVP